jgi:hypothetical protein
MSRTQNIQNHEGSFVTSAEVINKTYYIIEIGAGLAEPLGNRRPSGYLAAYSLEVRRWRNVMRLVSG